MKNNIQNILVEKDDWVFHEWDQGDYLYLIRSGSIGIFKQINSVDVEIAKLGAGEVFGEMSIISGKPRITIDKKKFYKGSNESIFIPKNSVHRIENLYNEPVQIVEAQNFLQKPL